MKKYNFYRFLCLLIMLVDAVYAQRERALDGNIWNRMKTENKMYYVTGFVNGLEKAENILDINTNIGKKHEFAFTEPYYVQRSRKNIREYIPNKPNRINLIINLLDAFYTDANNQKIPFPVALRIVLARDAGDIKKSDFWLKEARREIVRKGR